jgi:hypothetical protein
MKYRPEWKGKLHVSYYGDVHWGKQYIGRVWAHYKEGTKTPGGMLTNYVFIVHDGREFASKDLAIEALVADHLAGQSPVAKIGVVYSRTATQAQQEEQS